MLTLSSPTKASLSQMLMLLYCSSMAVAEWQCRTVEVGDHYPSGGATTGLISDAVRSVQIRFDDSAANYTCDCGGSPMPGCGQWNKLWGASRCGHTHHHHLDSDRFVWRMADSSTVEIAAYAYSLGVKPYSPPDANLLQVFSVRLTPGQTYTLKMTRSLTTTVYEVFDNDASSPALESKTVNHGNECTNFAEGYNLGFYFGGSCTAGSEVEACYDNDSAANSGCLTVVNYCLELDASTAFGLLGHLTRTPSCSNIQTSLLSQAVPLLATNPDGVEDVLYSLLDSQTADFCNCLIGLDVAGIDAFYPTSGCSLGPFTSGDLINMCSEISLNVTDNLCEKSCASAGAQFYGDIDSGVCCSCLDGNYAIECPDELPEQREPGPCPTASPTVAPTEGGINQNPNPSGSSDDDDSTTTTAIIVVVVVVVLLLGVLAVVIIKKRGNQQDATPENQEATFTGTPEGF